MCIGKVDEWDTWFLGMARYVSTRSKDPSTKVGAVIADPLHRFISLGYNGLPHGMHDDPKLLGNREAKIDCIIHAEENALLFAARPVEGCTVYTYPVPPCGTCMAKLRQSGIIRVVSPSAPAEFEKRWFNSLRTARAVADGAIRIDLIEFPHTES